MAEDELEYSSSITPSAMDFCLAVFMLVFDTCIRGLTFPLFRMCLNRAYTLSCISFLQINNISIFYLQKKKKTLFFTSHPIILTIATSESNLPWWILAFHWSQIWHTVDHNDSIDQIDFSSQSIISSQWDFGFFYWEPAHYSSPYLHWERTITK